MRIKQAGSVESITSRLWYFLEESFRVPKVVTKKRISSFVHSYYLSNRSCSALSSSMDFCAIVFFDKVLLLELHRLLLKRFPKSTINVDIYIRMRTCIWPFGSIFQFNCHRNSRVYRNVNILRKPFC